MADYNVGKRLWGSNIDYIMAFSVVGGWSGCGGEGGGEGAQFSPVSLKSRVSMGGWSVEEEDDGDKEDKGKVMEMVEANKECKEGQREAPLLLCWFGFLSSLILLLHPKDQFIH